MFPHVHVRELHNIDASISCQFHALGHKQPKCPKGRTLLKTSVQEIHSSISIYKSLAESNINRIIMRTSVQPYVPNMRRNVDCESTSSSFGLHTYHKVTQVYFYWPGLSFTSRIEIVIMTNVGV